MKQIELTFDKTKFKSEIVQDQQFHTQMQPSFTQSDNQAYQQLIGHWKNRQRQSLRMSADGTVQTLYTYDPNNPNFQVYKKPVSEDRQDIFKKYTSQIVKYLNAKFVIEQLIEPIQTYKVFDEEILHNVQFMYLLVFRAWCEINVVLKKFNQRKANTQSIYNRKRKKSITKIQFVFNPEDINLKYLVEPMIKLSVKIDYIFEQYHKILTLKEHYFKNKIKSIFQFIFKHKTKTIRDTFLCGFEGIDFTREEQINYLHENYITVAIDQLKVLEGLKYVNLVQKLAIFKKLMSLKIPKLQGYDDFQILKKSLINQSKQSQSMQTKL